MSSFYLDPDSFEIVLESLQQLPQRRPRTSRINEIEIHNQTRRDRNTTRVGANGRNEGTNVTQVLSNRRTIVRAESSIVVSAPPVTRHNLPSSRTYDSYYDSRNKRQNSIIDPSATSYPGRKEPEDLGHSWADTAVWVGTVALVGWLGLKAYGAIRKMI